MATVLQDTPFMFREEASSYQHSRDGKSSLEDSLGSISISSPTGFKSHILAQSGESGAEPEIPNLRPPLSDIPSESHEDENRTGNVRHGEPTRTTLSFGEVPFQGRSQQLEALHAAYRESYEHQVCRSILIEGSSGCGKTSLVKKFIVGAAAHDNSLVCCGRFEEAQWKRRPYSTLLGCFASLLTQLKSRDPNWVSRLDEEDRCNVQRLSNTFTELEAAIQTDFTGLISYENDAIRAGFATISFRNLFRTICSFCHVVFAIEDIGNVDHESAAILHALFNDGEARNTIFVGTRCNNQDSKGRNSWQQAVTVPLHIESRVTLTLGEFDGEEVARIVRYMLRLGDSSEAAPLAQLIHKRTGGNPFLVVGVMNVLRNKGLIYLDHQETTWRWRFEQIEALSDSADDSLAVVSAKFQALPRRVLPLLSAAAFLGSMTFDSAIVWEVFNYTDQADLGASQQLTFEAEWSVGDLDSLFALAVKEGILEALGSEHTYRFANGALLDHARSMLPSTAASSQRHRHVGKQLRQYLQVTKGDPESLLASPTSQQLLQLAVHHSNLGLAQFKSEHELFEIVQVNERAAQVATELWSFGTACKYLEDAVSLLELLADPWNSHYDEMLRLKTQLVDVLFYCGKLSKAEEVAKSVLHHAHTIHEKCPVYYRLVHILSQQGNIRKALTLHLDVLDELGTRLPRKFTKVHMLKFILKTKRQLKALDDKFWLERPHAIDSNVLLAQDFLISLADTSIQAGHREYRILGMLHGLKSSIDFGCTTWASLALATGATILAQTGDFQEAHRYSKLAFEKVNSNPENLAENGRALGVNYCYCVHWRKLYSECLDGLLESYKLSLRSGDTDSIVLSMIGYSTTYIHAGLPLPSVEPGMARFMRLLEDTGRTRSCLMFRPFLQFILNFTRVGRNPVGFLGDVLTASDVEDMQKPENNRPLHYYHLSRMISAYLFGNLEVANQMSGRLCAPAKEGPIVWLVPRFFYQGLIACGRGKRRRGAKFLKKILGFEANGNPNCRPMVLILQAELSVLSKKGEGSVLEGYDTAAQTAQQLGFLHLAALTNERAGHFVQRTTNMNARDKHERAREYIQKSYELYEQWGAKAKCAQLKTTYPKQFNLDNT